jgi:hypothetical protein
MAILSKDEAQAILKKVLSYSKADETEVNLNGSEKRQYPLCAQCRIYCR